MAIFICPECGAQISDRAERCVYCGYQIVRKPAEQLATDTATGAPVNNGNKKQGKTLLWRDVIRIIDKVIVAATLLIVIRYVIVPGYELRHCKDLIAQEQWGEAVAYITSVDNAECKGYLPACYYKLAEEKAGMQAYEEAAAYAGLVDTPEARALEQECYRQLYADAGFQAALEDCVEYRIRAEKDGESPKTICEEELRYLEEYGGAKFYDERLGELAAAYYSALQRELDCRQEESYDREQLEEIARERLLVVARLIEECNFFAEDNTTASYIKEQAEATQLAEMQQSIEDWTVISDILEQEQFAEKVSRAYSERTFGWDTALIGEQGYYASAELELKNLAADKKFRAGNGSASVKQYIGLPYPMKAPGVSGSCSEGCMYLGNTELLTMNGAALGVSFRVFNPNGGEELSTTLRLVSMGTRVDPPEAPTLVYNETAAQQLIAIADSYVQAQLNGRKFQYGKNFFYYNVNTINDENGAAMMECDTFVGMALRGIPYEKSPFANETPGYTCSYRSMMTQVNPKGFTWCNSLLKKIQDRTYLHGDMRYAADYAWMCWSTEGSIFSNIEYAQTGDLVFWRRTDRSNFFDNISHVAILSIEDGTRYVYEVTASKYSEGRIVQKVLLDDKATPAYFGRIAGA